MLHRWLNEQHIICFINFSKQEQMKQVPAYADNWKKLIASTDRQWPRMKDAAYVVNAKDEIKFQPEFFIMFSN